MKLCSNVVQCIEITERIIEHVVCVTVNSRCNNDVTTEKGKVTTYVRKKIMKVSTKLSMSDILNEAIGECEISKEMNQALNMNNFTVSLSESELNFLILLTFLNSYLKSCCELFIMERFFLLRL